MHSFHSMIKFLLVLVVMFSISQAGRGVYVGGDGRPVAGMPCDCPSGWSCRCPDTLPDPSPSLETLFYQQDAGLKEVYSECMRDVYFGNGVWNDRYGAWSNMLQLFDEFNKIGRYNPKLHHFGLAYNIGTPASASTSGAFDDIIETFWQLKESGQISTEYYATMYLIARYGAGSNVIAQMGVTAFAEYVFERLPEIKVSLTANYETMFSKYQKYSFKNGHRVMLVAHSQGNLFGNYMYENKFNWQQEYFRMISVATPADHVAGDGPHITAQWDMVIRFIPNSLDYNTPGVGHEFIETYLADTAGDKLSRYMMYADMRLEEIETQWQVAAKSSENTCNYRVGLEHKHKIESQIQNIKSVYPFDLDQENYIR